MGMDVANTSLVNHVNLYHLRFCTYLYLFFITLMLWITQKKSGRAYIEIASFLWFHFKNT